MLPGGPSVVDGVVAAAADDQGFAPPRVSWRLGFPEVRGSGSDSPPCFLLLPARAGAQPGSRWSPRSPARSAGRGGTTWTPASTGRDLGGAGAGGHGVLRRLAVVRRGRRLRTRRRDVAQGGV